MKNTMLQITILLSILSSGCTNEKIEIVKNSPLNSGLTFSQALDNAPYCQNSTWHYERDNNQRDLVIHTCEIIIKKSNLETYVNKTAPISNETAIFLSGISKAERKIKELAYAIRLATESSSKAEKHEKYIIENSCNYKKLPNYPANDPCYFHLSMSNQYHISEKELKDTWEVGSIKEASQLLEERKKLLEEDKKKIAEITKEFNAKKIHEFPETVHITREVTITLLPNNNFEWTYPSFYYASADSYYNSKGNDQPTSDIIRPIRNKNHDIDHILLSKFFKLDMEEKKKDFNNFIYEQCFEGCPIHAMTL